MENEFLEAIRQQPDDKNLRLEYADWLAGQGHAERAEFLRLHTALGGVSWKDEHTIWQIQEGMNRLRKKLPPKWVADLYCYDGKSLIDRFVNSTMSLHWIRVSGVVNLPQEMIAPDQRGLGNSQVCKWQPIPSIVTEEDLENLEGKWNIQYPALYRMLLLSIHFVQLLDCGFIHHLHLPGNWLEALESRLSLVSTGGLPQWVMFLWDSVEMARDVGFLFFDTTNLDASGDSPVVGFRGVAEDGSFT